MSSSAKYLDSSQLVGFGSRICGSLRPFCFRELLPESGIAFLGWIRPKQMLEVPLR